MGPNHIISVVLPCYNVGQYVGRCLDSILASEYPYLQVICVVDGATDNTLEVIRSYDDPRIEVIVQPNSGVSAARNRGIDAATGRWLCFVDPDDWVHDTYFSSMIKVQQVAGVSVVCCNYVGRDIEQTNFVTEGTYIVSHLYDRWDDVVVRNYVWCKMYDRALVGNLRFKSGLTWGEDRLFNFMLLASHPEVKCAMSTKALYHYFQRPGSLTNSCDGRDYYQLFKAQTEMLAENAAIMPMLVTETVKSGLASRYLCSFSDQGLCRKITSEMKAVVRLHRLDGSLKTRLVMRAFVWYPSLYRRWRIHTDPTLLRWENDQRVLAAKPQGAVTD